MPRSRKPNITRAERVSAAARSDGAEAYRVAGPRGWRELACARGWRAAAAALLAGPALLAGLWLACRVTAWACVTMRAVGHL